MSGRSRLVLRCYPPSFRARYGAELETLVADLGRRHTGDLLLGAVRAWVRPALPGPDGARRRLQATVSTVWVSWCLGALAVPVANRSLLDPAVPGVDGTGRHLLTAASVLFAAGWVVALAGALPLVLRSLLPAVRDRRWTALRPLAPAASMTAVVAIGTVTLAAGRGGSARVPAPEAVLAVAWLLALAALVLTAAGGPPLVLDRLAPRRGLLTAPAAAAALVALVLAGAVGCSVAAVARAGHPALFGAGWVVLPALAGSAVLVLVAGVSAARGVHALLPHGS